MSILLEILSTKVETKVVVLIVGGILLIGLAGVAGHYLAGDPDLQMICQALEISPTNPTFKQLLTAKGAATADCQRYSVEK